MSDTCCIKGCEKEVLAMGMCVNHWRANKKHGSPVVVRQLAHANRGLTNEERFLKSVTKIEGGCWIWNASRDEDGYGVFSAVVNGVQVRRAHRYAHAVATGEVLDRRVAVMHSCDNPPCCNPDHLSSGTFADNTADMMAKGRHKPGNTVKISDDQVREILRDPRQYAVIAQAYGIHKQHVVELKTRTSRKSVEIDPSEIVRGKRGAAGEARSDLLTADDIRFIRSNDMRNNALALKYGVSQAHL